MIAFLASIIAWLKAFYIVSLPFLKIALVWAGWQMSLGMMAWSTARFYALNCAPAGLSGFASSLFSIGSPICVSTWFSHAAFLVAYIASFFAAVMMVILWVWKKTSSYSMIDKLQNEIQQLKKGIDMGKTRQKFKRN